VFIALFLIFVVVPVIEISILLQVGEQLGAVPTVALVILTAAIGASLVRSQGLQTLMAAQQKLQQGQQPGQEMVEGMMLAIAGVLLVTPGFVTDGLGLLLLTPFTRKPLANYLLSKLVRKTAGGSPFSGQGFGQGFEQQQGSSEDIIEGEFTNKDGSRGLDTPADKDNKPDTKE
jgi:UPF0716 protein FxsA